MLDAVVLSKNAGILVVCRGFLQVPPAQGVGADRLKDLPLTLQQLRKFEDKFTCDVVMSGMELPNT